MSEHNSCLVRKFQSHEVLEENEIQLLLELERSPESLAPEQDLWRQGDNPAEELAIMSKGWAYGYVDLPDGDRTITNVYLPGDVIALEEYVLNGHQTSVKALTDCTICRFPHKHLLDIFDRSSKLTKLFFNVACLQQVMLIDRIIHSNRRSADHRIAHFICEIHSRLRRTNPDLDNHFRIPMTQEHLASALGMTPVHVSRTISELSKSNLILRNREKMTILDLGALREFSEFNSAYY